MSVCTLQVTRIDGGAGTPPGLVTMMKHGEKCCSWQNTYSLGFPWELDGGLKATFIGAAILLDYALHQNQGSGA